MFPPPEPRQTGNSFGFTAWRGPSAVMASPHAHNDIEINFCSSSLTYESGGRTSTLTAGIPFAFWGAKHHQLVDIAPGSPLAFATIPLAQFMSWSLPGTVKNRLLHGEILKGEEGAYDELASRFERWSIDLHQGGDLQRRAAELEIEALLVRMSLGEWAEQRTDPARTSVNLRRAAEMASYIAAHSLTPLRVTDVAKAAHLHPNRAAKIFRDVFGTSISGYLGQYRVAEAQRLLLTTDFGSAAISTMAGFQSLSAYHEAFATICRMSPTEWRRRHRGAETLPAR